MKQSNKSLLLFVDEFSMAQCLSFWWLEIPSNRVMSAGTSPFQKKLESESNDLSNQLRIFKNYRKRRRLIDDWSPWIIWAPSLISFIFFAFKTLREFRWPLEWHESRNVPSSPRRHQRKIQLQLLGLQAQKTQKRRNFLSKWEKRRQDQSHQRVLCWSFLDSRHKEPNLGKCQLVIDRPWEIHGASFSFCWDFREPQKGNNSRKGTENQPSSIAEETWEENRNVSELQWAQSEVHYDSEKPLFSDEKKKQWELGRWNPNPRVNWAEWIK